MDGTIDGGISLLNALGRGFCAHAWGTLIQSSVLIVVLLALDLLLRKRVRAVVRCAIWMLVFVKLLLPPTLSLPTGIGYYRPCRTVAIEDSVQPAAPTAAKAVDSSVATPTRQTSDMVAVSDVVAQPVETAIAGAPPVRVGSTIIWQGWVFLAWLAGVTILCICLARRLGYVRQLVRESGPASSPLREALLRCAERIELRRCPELRLSEAVPGPVVCGLLRPAVLMPTTLAGAVDEDRLQMVLTHELAHIKRGDLWVNFVQTLLLVAYFYHPLLWLVNGIVRRLREKSVDEAVLVALETEAGRYGTTLIDLAEMTFRRPAVGLRLIGIAESRRALEGRIQHMMTRPKPRTASVGLWGLMAIAVAAAILLPMAAARNKGDSPDSGQYKFLLLDDKDSGTNDEDRCDDRLYLVAGDGTIEAALSGFNVCESFGGSHMLAVDEARKVLWVAENAGGRLFRFDLTTGLLLGKTPDLRAGAVAVDPATGNAWVTILEGGIGQGHIQVVSSSGRKLDQYPISGSDIAYSPYDKSFWVVGKNVCKLDGQGNVLGRIGDEIPWTAVSVSVDAKTGHAWVVVRDHPNIPESRPELWCVDRNVKRQQRIDLGDVIPFCVAVDSDNDVVWVGCLGATLRYTTGGRKLKTARFASAYSVVPGRAPNEVLTAHEHGLFTAVVDASGAVSLGDFPPLRDKLGSNWKWLARVPVAEARLQSSSDLADLMGRPPRPEEFAPASAEKLADLGKALLIHANDYEDKFPDTLQQLREYLEEKDLAWLEQNVVYLGKGKTVVVRPDTVLAYDKTLLEQAKGTLVLFSDSHVAFKSVREFNALGIKAESVQDADADEIATLKARVESAKRLSELGKAVLLYARDHDGRLPERIEDVRDDVGTAVSWLTEHVAYWGKGVTTRDNPVAPIAYDKTLIQSGAGTNVLYLDAHVTFESRTRLEEIGIQPPGKSMAVVQEEVATQTRVESQRRLEDLGKALLIYANDHDDEFPETLADLRDEVGAGMPWLLENVTYLGKGISPMDRPERVLAYDKTLLAKAGGTNVLYLDSHVEFVPRDKLPMLGLGLR